MSDLHGLSNAEKRRRGQEDLIAGLSPTAVAERYGVGRNTVSGWHTPEIHAERDRRRAESIAAARARLSEMATGAMDALHEVASDPSAPQAARVAAANSILDRSGVGKVDEITVRVEEQSATDVAAGLAAILGRARAALSGLPPVPQSEDPADAPADPEADPDGA